jgi:UDP-N-acetylglucosamine acyltransferase
MAYVHIAHDCVVHDHVVLANSVNLAGHVEVEDYAIIGGVTPVHQFVRIGRHSIVGGGFRVPKDIPPYMKAGGNPLRLVGLNSLGLERHRFSPEASRELKEAFRLLCRAGLNVSQALAALKEKFPDSREVRHLVEFVAASDRGIVR